MLRFNRRLIVGLFAVCFAASTGIAQNPSVLDQSKAALTSKSSIANVTLNGTFVSTEGSLVQNGNVQLVAGSDGTYNIALTKNSGAAGEMRSLTDSVMGCAWTDPSGKIYPVDSFNCQTPAWFMPEIPLMFSSETTPEWQLLTQSADGSGERLGFNFVAATAAGSNGTPPIAIDLELSSATFLPTKASFLIHPDGQSYINISVEITYQNYQQVSGVNVPLHIQKFVNGTLVLDITVTGAIVN